MVISMQLNIEKHSFGELKNILSIKNHLEKISNIDINGSYGKGTVEVNISYTDLDGAECFKVLSYPFELDLDELKILDVSLGKVRVYVVEAQGINLEYELIVNYLLKEEDKIVEIEVIDESQIDVDNKQKVETEKMVDEIIEDDLDKIKDEALKYYEDKLASSLKKEESIVITKGRDTVNSFLDFFDANMSYYKIKCLYVENDSDLKKISEEFNISLEKLMTGYDPNTKKVIFKIE